MHPLVRNFLRSILYVLPIIGLLNWRSSSESAKDKSPIDPAYVNAAMALFITELYVTYSSFLEHLDLIDKFEQYFLQNSNNLGLNDTNRNKDCTNLLTEFVALNTKPSFFSFSSFSPAPMFLITKLFSFLLPLDYREEEDKFYREEEEKFYIVRSCLFFLKNIPFSHAHTNILLHNNLPSYYNTPATIDEILPLPYNLNNPDFLLDHHQVLTPLFHSVLASEPQRRAAQQLGQDFLEATPFNSDVVSIITSYLITNETETHHKATNQMILNHFNSASKRQWVTAQIQNHNSNISSVRYKSE